MLRNAWFLLRRDYTCNNLELEAILLQRLLLNKKMELAKQVNGKSNHRLVSLR